METRPGRWPPQWAQPRVFCRENKPQNSGEERTSWTPAKAPRMRGTEQGCGEGTSSHKLLRVTVNNERINNQAKKGEGLE